MISKNWSKVTLPAAEGPNPTILGFLAARFPCVAPELWDKRMAAGKIADGDGDPVTINTAYREGKMIRYYREVETEPVIPFAEAIVFQNDHLLVACKPHFLPVNPTGPYVAECLLSRLRKRTGNDDLVPVNRIDRETAGLVLFSANCKTRDAYCRLFREGEVEKTYEAVADYAGVAEKRQWLVENRIVHGDPWFRMTSAPGVPNARSIIKVEEVREGRAHFILHPLTGKTHQLRLHMSGLGFGILNDRYYPELQPQRDDDFEKPLQLLAKRVRFRDPITATDMEFASERRLEW